MSIRAVEKTEEGEVAAVFAQILAQICSKPGKISLRNDHSFSEISRCPGQCLTVSFDKYFIAHARDPKENHR